MTYFYDAEDPALIPSADVYVALYADGDFKATPAQYSRFPRRQRRWITVVGDENVGIADYEPENPVYDEKGALADWAADRLRGHRGETIVYSDRVDVKSALEELGKMQERVLWWIATGDGKDWTAEELSADLAASFGVVVPASRIWANQNVWAAGYDRSNLFGKWRA